jgi:hypothetical protein
VSSQGRPCHDVLKEGSGLSVTTPTLTPGQQGCPMPPQALGTVTHWLSQMREPLFLARLGLKIVR